MIWNFKPSFSFALVKHLSFIRCMVGLIMLTGQTEMQINTNGIDANTDHKHAPTDATKSQSQNGSDVLFDILFRLVYHKNGRTNFNHSYSVLEFHDSCCNPELRLYYSPASMTHEGGHKDTLEALLQKQLERGFMALYNKIFEHCLTKSAHAQHEQQYGSLKRRSASWIFSQR